MTGENDETFYIGMIAQATVIDNKGNQVKCQLEGCRLIGFLRSGNDGKKIENGTLISVVIQEFGTDQ